MPPSSTGATTTFGGLSSVPTSTGVTLLSAADRLSEAGWEVSWTVTESAGLKIFLVNFHGHRVLWEATLPYVVVEHTRPEAKPDEPADAHGPWWSPLGARRLVGPVRRTSFRGGFELAADFAMGIYRYTQLWRFHADGRLDPWLTIHGRGVHDSHTYHPHWRFDFDLDGALDDALEHWADGRWNRVAEEGWLPHRGDASPEGWVWRQIDSGSGASVSLRPTQMEDAELFALRHHPSEWPPFTPRPTPGAPPFPAGYLGSEPLDGQDVILWYVAHVHWGTGFPYTSGPWIRVEGL
jgi:hypothetical protein